MFRYLRYLFLLVLAAGLLTLALANREMVTLDALPPDLGAFLGFEWSLSLPLYAVILASIFAGLLIGFVWEWFREHKHRANASNRAREIARLERELASLRRGQPGDKDEVLTLLDRPADARAIKAG
ncbi:LapA family protein [Szabonella alba]|uniref:LapA family protein n=1 Tax=Szabonella alba TaxID=2804194 RepID=A0A8K0VAU4_9RHOB|nr:LapA family protein [Szabonella alba]MBL4918819.1 LapA family protein [Szabonella alba]